MVYVRIQVEPQLALIFYFCLFFLLVLQQVRVETEEFLKLFLVDLVIVALIGILLDLASELHELLDDLCFLLAGE